MMIEIDVVRFVYLLLGYFALGTIIGIITGIMIDLNMRKKKNE